MKKLLLLSAVIALTASCGGNGSSKNENKAGEAAAPEASKTVAAPEAVDLGLSVKWASCNLGAANASEPGNYYAWGETAPKDSYGKETYRYCDEKKYFTKYIPEETIGYRTCDGLLKLESADDAATAALGAPWRMPTRDEVLELIEKCEIGFSDGAFIVTGPNGNSIRISASGYRSDAKLYQEKSPYLWCSTLFGQEQTILDEPSIHYHVMYGDVFDVNVREVVRQYREYGLPIRPVRD